MDYLPQEWKKAMGIFPKRTIYVIPKDCLYIVCKVRNKENFNI